MRSTLFVLTLTLLSITAASAYSDEEKTEQEPQPGWPELEIVLRGEDGESKRLALPDVDPHLTPCTCRQEVSVQLKSYDLVGGGDAIKLWSYHSGVESDNTAIEIFLQVESANGASALEIVGDDGEPVRSAELPVHWSFHRVRLGSGQSLAIRVPENDASDTIRARLQVSWSMEENDK